MTLRWVAVVVLVVCAAAIGWYVSGGGAGGPVGSSGDAKAYFVSTRLSDEEALELRSKSRWDGMLAKDMERVYLHATPAYRAVYDLEHLKRQYFHQLQRRDVDIQSVTVDPENASEGKVLVLVHSTTRGFDGESLIELTSPVTETWIKEDGQWWFAEPR